MQHNVIFSVAKKEIMDNIRNKWIIFASVIFAILTLVTSYFGSHGQGWLNLGFTIALMMVYVELLIPIIGLLLGYAAITGEIEQGTMNALLPLPITRNEIIIGKFIGLNVVISLTILIGFGLAGGIIALNVSNVNYADYGVFIAASILIGLVFVSFALLLSSVFKKRSTTIGAAIFFWAFFAILFNLIFSGILSTNLYYYAVLFNPLDLYSYLIELNVGPVKTMIEGISINYPSFYSNELMILLLFVWIVLPLVFTILVFKQRDI